MCSRSFLEVGVDPLNEDAFGLSVVELALPTTLEFGGYVQLT